MKWKQRLALQYFSTKLKLIELFSLSKAGKTAFKLFCTPYSRRKTYEKPAVFEKGNPVTFSFKDHLIHGFEWKPENAGNKKLLICHGFDSLSYKFAYYIEPLLASGYTIYAFDAPAHGLSSGKTINALLYRDLILEVNYRYGPMNSIMAHSFGCIAATLAIEHNLTSLQKLVLIAPATETTRSISDFARHLKISNKLKGELEKIIVTIGGQPPSWYSVARIVKKIKVETLWVHDKYDPITPYEDMKHLQDEPLPHVQFFITESLGHSLYRNKYVADKIISWIKK